MYPNRELPTPQVDPTLTRADRLVGQVLGEVGALPDVFTELEINFFLLRRLLGVRTTVRSSPAASCFPLPAPSGILAMQMPGSSCAQLPGPRAPADFGLSLSTWLCF